MVNHFGDSEQVSHWLNNYNLALGDTPNNIIQSVDGVDRVREIFIRLMHGMTA